MNTRGGDVDSQLPDGDLDPAHAPVADTENALGIGCDDEIDLIRSHPVIAKRSLNILDRVD